MLTVSKKRPKSNNETPNPAQVLSQPMLAPAGPAFEKITPSIQRALFEAARSLGEV